MVASTSESIAWIVLLVSLAGWAVYAVVTVRGGRSEAGSEQFLAANRKPYYDDEVLEGRRLERVQLLGLAFLAIVTVALPLYWIMEPSRQEEAQFGFDKRFVTWGSRLFAPTAEGGFNCAGCHGGMKATGGVAPYAVTDPNTGEVKSVSWKAPALNTVLYRYSDDEVRFVLNYGRPFSPMSAWGTVGGGPLTSQAVDTLVNYIQSIQVPQDNCEETRGSFNPTCTGGALPAEKNKEIEDEAKRLVANGTYSSMGEAYFNLDLGGGAYSCARCHTKGWSYGDPQVTGGGALGPNLTGGSSVRQFASLEEMVTFLKSGSELGKRYGAQGQGSGRMPAFGQIYTDAQIREIVNYVRSL
jgi:mono/diheme cytochrome c family protein